MRDPKIISTKQASELKQCSQVAIRDALSRGVIDGQKVGREHVVYANQKFNKWEPNRERQKIGIRSQQGRTK